MSTILAIDDKKDNLITISALLKNLKPDCRVITAGSGAEGIETAVSQRPDAIILDVKMPGMDGFEACRRLKSLEETRHIPIILLTAIKTDVESRIQGLETGADAFLTKPIDESELVAQINVMLRIKKAEDLLRREKDILEEQVLDRTRSLVESELKLKKERDFLKSLEDASPAYYVAVDPAGRVLSMNRSLLEALGFTAADVRGRNYFEDFVPETFREITRKMHGELAPGRTGVLECPVRARDGRELLVEWHIRALYGDGGAEDFIFSVGIDVTERKGLEKSIINANEKERHRISQELHDGLGRYLTGVAFKGEIMRLKLKERLEESREMEEVVDMIHSAIDQTRELARDLCPVDMGTGGLRSAVEDLRMELERSTGRTCLLQWDEGVEIRDDLVASNLFYIVKEAVDNAVRHGDARNIIITLSSEKGVVSLRIDDDGKGLGANPDTIEGLGLRIIRYRAWIIGASIDIGKNRGGGVSIVCSLTGKGLSRNAGPEAAPAKKAIAGSQDAKVFIIDSSPVVRQGLIQIVGGGEGLQVCGEAKNSDEAVRLIARNVPDLVIIDISIEGVGGIDLIKALKSRYPSLEVLVLSDYEETIYAERALRAGAGGYIMKSEASQEVLQAVRTVLGGRQYISERLKEELLVKLSRDNPDKGLGVEKLSNREFEIFQLIGRGLSNRNIADKINISVKTVENYRERIKAKLNVESSSNLVQYAVQWMINKS
jgi:PAS domain S-box-containing protein